MRKILIFLILLMISSISFSEELLSRYEYKWVDLSGSFQGFTARFNIANMDGSGWSVSASRFSQFSLLKTFEEKGTGRILDEPSFRAVSLSRIWSSTRRWGRFDAGIGVGYGKGTWLENCEETQPTFIVSTEACDENSLSLAGIPVHASAIFGKHAGFRLGLEVFATDSQVFSQLNFGLSLGVFSKQQ